METLADGSRHGFWCCPTPGCDGRGFGFDILPTDPEYRDERGGWVIDDEDEEEEEGEDADAEDSGSLGDDWSEFADGAPDDDDGEIPW